MMTVGKGEAIKEKGNNHFLQKKYHDAIHCYNQALNQNGEKPTYYVNRALCYIKLKQWDKVYQDARHCLDLDPKRQRRVSQVKSSQKRLDLTGAKKSLTCPSLA
ncbi:unnamed protein product [Rotaria magnacalcarata]|uniref:Uncharacterized protein n=1 Tax=Rotaria magnacalcarata TaxID=392030 RepID=A0A817ADN9_9BILA|nr:unnamed protein product [Rotaria magnacalcarata]